jgi:hypothetical protein
VRGERSGERRGFSRRWDLRVKVGKNLLFSRAEGLSFYVNYVQRNSTKLGINSTYV